MSTKEQLINTLCDNLQIPGLTDNGFAERALVEKTVGAVYEHVPPFVWGIVISGADGFDVKEVDAIVSGIADSLAKYAKVSWLPETIKREVIRQVLDTIRKALRVDEYLKLSPVA